MDHEGRPRLIQSEPEWHGGAGEKRIGRGRVGSPVDNFDYLWCLNFVHMELFAVFRHGRAFPVKRTKIVHFSTFDNWRLCQIAEKIARFVCFRGVVLSCAYDHSRARDRP